MGKVFAVRAGTSSTNAAVQPLLRPHGGALAEGFDADVGPLQRDGDLGNGVAPGALQPLQNLSVWKAGANIRSFPILTGMLGCFPCERNVLTLQRRKDIKQHRHDMP